MRTAPVPNMVAIPGMNPGLFVMGGGGDGGGSGAGAGKGKGGKQGANGKNGGKDANGGGKNAGACGKGTGAPSCTNPRHGGSGGTAAGDPVDVMTGRVFTVPSVDLALPGPFPLVIERRYSSTACEKDVGLGFGWTHSFAWRIHVRRRSVRIEQDSGTVLSAERPAPGESMRLFGGLTLRLASAGFALSRADGTVLLFHADDFEDDTCRLSAVVDRNGNVIRLRYSGEELVEIIDAVGRTVRVARDSSRRIAGFEVQTSTAVKGSRAFYRYEYDSAGDLVAVVDAAGYVTRFAYQDHLLVRNEHPDGLVVHYRYDDQQRCVETWGERSGPDISLAADVPDVLADDKTKARGLFHTKLLYSGDGYSEVVDSTQVKRYFGNEYGQVTKAVWGGGVSTHEFDELGNWVTFTDATGVTTHVQRDAAGRIVATIDGLGRRTELTRSDLGDLVTMVRPDGQTIELTRDERGNLLRVDDSKGLVVAYEYAPNGLVTRATLPNGGVTLFEHDAHSNVVSVTEPNGAKKRIDYDDLGRPYAFTNAAGDATHYGYDARGLLVHYRDPAGGVTTFEHDERRRLRRTTDPAGRVSTLVWGGLNALCEVHRPDGTSIRYKYDREGRFVEVHNEAGKVHRFVRNAAGHVIREETLDGRVHELKRDAFGRLLRWKSASGQSMELTYDAAGQVVRRAFGDDLIEELEYDPAGRLVSARSGDVESRLTYDARGLVTAESILVGGEEHKIEAEYDAMGRRTARRSSLGYSEALQRDIMGDLVGVAWSGASVRIVRDIFRQETAVMLPGGGRIEYDYDAVGRLAKRSVMRASDSPSPAAAPAWVGAAPREAAAETTYRWSPITLLEEESDSQRGVVTYRYDPIGQLLGRLPAQGASELFHFDAEGNMQEQGGPKRVHGPGGRTLRKGDVEYAYDDEGHLVQKRLPNGDVWTYEWDGRGLLSKVEDPTRRTIEFSYDAFHRRVEKRVVRDRRVEEAVRFVWDGDQILHEVVRRAAAEGDPVVEVKTYCFADGHLLPMAEIDAAGQRRFYVHAPNGFPELSVADDGRVVASQDHTAYGAVKGEGMTPIRFPGQYADKETGLYYNRHRYYDPDIGMYISPDPIEVSRTTRLFEYADSSPVASIDPDGLQAMTTTITRTDAAGNPLPDLNGRSSTGRDPANPVQIHPTVWNNMAPQAQVTQANGQTQMEFPRTGRHPASCSEPDVLSQQLYDYERRNGLPPGTCGSANDPNNMHLRGALREVNNVTSNQDGGGARNACPNCGVLMANLQNQANQGLAPGEAPVNLVGAVTPGIDAPSARWSAAMAAGAPTRPAAQALNPGSPRDLRVQPPPGVVPRGGRWL